MIGGQFCVRRKKVKKSIALFLTLFVVFAPGTKAQEKLPLKLIATTPLPDLVGDLEFFAPDLKGNRLFLCAENSKTSRFLISTPANGSTPSKDLVNPTTLFICRTPTSLSLPMEEMTSDGSNW